MLVPQSLFSGRVLLASKNTNFLDNDIIYGRSKARRDSEFICPTTIEYLDWAGLGSNTEDTAGTKPSFCSVKAAY